MKIRDIRVLSRLRSDESGQDLIEYALLAFMIAFGAVSAIQGLASHIGSAYSSVGSQLTAVFGSGGDGQGGHGGDHGGHGGHGDGDGHGGGGGQGGNGGQGGQGGGGQG